MHKKPCCRALKNICWNWVVPPLNPVAAPGNSTIITRISKPARWRKVCPKPRPRRAPPSAWAIRAAGRKNWPRPCGGLPGGDATRSSASVCCRRWDFPGAGARSLGDLSGRQRSLARRPMAGPGRWRSRLRRLFRDAPNFFLRFAAGLDDLRLPARAEIHRGLKWTLTACFLCALHAAFINFSVDPHCLFVGYLTQPNWLCAAIPLLCATAAAARQWIAARGLALASLAAVVFLAPSAQADEKPLLHRGWIGGEYKVDRPWSVRQALFPPPEMLYDRSFPQAVRRSQHAAIKITELGANTPAALAGFARRRSDPGSGPSAPWRV